MSGPDRIRLRIRFSKLGKIRWTSHRDVARMWERAFRRVQLPLAYSEGFSPRPRVSFGLALPTGYESVAEFLDVELTSLDGIELDALAGRLSAALPIGVDATAIARLPQGASSLQEEVALCSWRWTAVPAVDAPAGVEEIVERVPAVMAADALEIARHRKGVEVVEDIRPGLLSLQVESVTAEGAVLTADLAAVPRAVRPTDVMIAIGPGFEERQVRRTHQWIMRHGAHQEPLAAARDEAPAPHAMERAS
ncbi:MAG TPA: TIGR03936 family radical SAM-associated protein [Acidimicrobiales bacterium]|nr:TIGR03936 family radical SAM-associated protein [Acidimicrobiales bacterium]